MYSQQYSTFVHASRGIYFSEPAPSWSDVEPVEQQTQATVDNDVFTGMGQWNGQQTSQQFHHQWKQPMEDFNGYSVARRYVQPATLQFDQQISSPVVNPVVYNAGNSSPVEIAGTTYFFPSLQCSTQSVYSMSSECSSGDSSPSTASTSTSTSDVCLNNIKNLSSFEIRRLLKSWTLTREERDIAGYPRFDQFGRVLIQPSIWEQGSKVWIADNEPMRECSRCFKAFEVLANGHFPAGRGICRYKVKQQKKTYNYHVTKQRFTSELKKFVATPAPIGKDDSRSSQIYAIDAEMVLTIAGPALARVCIVGFDGHVEMDLLIKPEAKVVDPVTQYSGVTMGMLERATHTIESLHDVLFELINSETILIGHGLESDLKAMRLVHQKVIDTAVMYRDEGRNKVALRTLARRMLNRGVQQDNASTFGHNPEEDAVASLDLVKYKINYG